MQIHTSAPREHNAPYVQLIADDALIDLWLAGRSPHTQAAYRESVARLRAHLDRPLGEVTMPDLQAFAAGLATVPMQHGRRKGQPLAPASQARTLAAIKSLYAFACRHGYLAHDPTGALRMPKGRDTLAARILDEADVRRLVAAAATPVETALLRLLYGGGLRVSEACGLRWCDVQPAGQGAQLAVFGKGGKNRIVIVAAAVQLSLEAIRPVEGAADVPVLGLDRRRAWALVKGAARRAGIAEGVSPHWLRHAHASHALDRGAPLSLVRDSLGHASVATTSRYLHAKPADGSGRYLAE